VYVVFFFLLSISIQLRSTLFPYTTLFRSVCYFARRTAGLNTDASPRDAGDSAVHLGAFRAEAAAVLFSRILHRCLWSARCFAARSEEHTSELQSRSDLVCRLLLEKKNHMK